MSKDTAVQDQPQDAPGWLARALQARTEQRMAEANAAFARAELLAPGNLAIVLGHAQARHAAGLPAADWFRRASALAPDQLEITRQLANALAADGEPEKAESLLNARLAQHPDWLEGHKSLATMRWTAGQRDSFLDSYRDACRAQPRNVQLRLAWFYTLATLRDWPAATRVLDEGEAALGDRAPYTLARLYLACAAMTLLLPGTALLYYGEELGMADMPQELLDAAPLGPKRPRADERDRSRAPMPWTEEPNAGFTRGRPWLPVSPQSATRNVAAEQRDTSSFYHWYRKLLQLRCTNPVFRDGLYVPLESGNAQVFAFARAAGRGATSGAVVVLNMSASEQAVHLAGLPGSISALGRRLIVSPAASSSGELDFSLAPFGVRVLEYGAPLH